MGKWRPVLVGSSWRREVLNEGVSGCDWGRVVDEQGRTTWPLGLPAMSLQGSLGVWLRQEGMTS